MSPACLKLILHLLEAPSLQFPRNQVIGYHGPVGEELIASKWLVPDGFAHAAEPEDDEDGTILAVGHDHRRRLGFHHPARGWVDVEQATLQCFKPDLAAIFGRLLGSELALPPRGIIELEAGLAWHLGTMRLGRLALTEVWLARRLGSQAGFQALRAASSRRPPTSPRLVLTTTRHNHLPTETPAKTRIVPINDVLSSHEQASIDTHLLQARFAGQAVQAVTGSLHLSEDGRVLTINGETTITFRGEVQIAMIRILFAAHQAGRPMKATDILADAQSQSDSLDQAFGRKWKELRPFLRAVNGMWGFDPSAA